MQPAETFPRLLSAVTAFHWTATFGVLAVSAQQWRPDGAGGTISALARPFLQGRLGHQEAAFALAVIFSVVALAFLWLFVTSLIVDPRHAGDYRDVSQLAYAAGIGGLSIGGGFAAVSGSIDALLISFAIVAALFASAIAVGAGPQGHVRRERPSLAKSMAARAAESARSSRFTPNSAESSAGKDR